MKKPSFLERLTGSVATDEYDRVLDSKHEFGAEDEQDGQYAEEDENWDNDPQDDHKPKEGELPVDMYQTNDTIVKIPLISNTSES